VVLSVLLVGVFKTGLGGLAVSASVAANIIGFTLLYKLNKRVNGILSKDFLGFALKIFVSVAIMGVSVLFANRITADMNKYVAVIVPAIVGAVIYFAFCAIFRLNEIAELFGIVKSFLKRGNKSE
jgi:peptidoglycan biosynthesis protein MviN/MurJ (putative lipid II flippase)